MRLEQLFRKTSNIMSNQSGGAYTPTSDTARTPKSSVSEKTGTVLRKSTRPRIPTLKAPVSTGRASRLQKDMNEIMPGITVNQSPMALDENLVNPVLPNDKSSLTPFHSTPATSPSTERDNMTPKIRLANYQDDYQFTTTPLIDSAGTKLISSPSPVPKITAESTPVNLNNYLDTVNAHIDKYGNDLSVDPNAKRSANERYKDLLVKVSNAKSIAIERNDHALLIRCSELSSKLEDFKLKWNMSSNNSSLLNQSDFHGFPTLPLSIYPAPNIVPELSKQNNDPAVKPKQSTANILREEFKNQLSDLEKRVPPTDLINGLTSRINALELKQQTPLMELNATSSDAAELFTQLADIGTRMNELENTLTSYQLGMNKYSNLASRISVIENDLRGNSNRINSLEDQLASTNSKIEDQTRLSINQFNVIQGRLDNLSAQFNSFTQLQHGMGKEFSSFRMTINNELENIHGAVENLAGNPTSQQTTAIVTEHQDRTNRTSAKQVESNYNHTRSWVDCHKDNFNNQSHCPQSRLTPTGPQIPRGSQTPRNCVDSDDNSTASIQSSFSANLDIYGKSLNRQSKSLKSLLSPEPSTSLDKSTLQDVYQVKLPNVNSERRELQKVLRDYLKYNDANIDLCTEVEKTIEKAESWCNKMRDLYLSKGHNKKSQTGKLYDSLDKFSPKSDVDVFEFVKRFECITSDFEIPSERAELLFTKYLDSNVQDELIKYRDDYDAMKKVLMERYGDVRTMVNNALDPVTKDGPPKASTDLKTKLSYFRKFQSSLQKINKLLSSADVDTNQLVMYVYGHDFMKILLHHIPEWCVDIYIDSMLALNQSIAKVSGKIAFDTMISSVDRLYQKYDDLARTELPYTAKENKSNRKEKAKTDKMVSHVANPTPSSTESSTESDISDSDSDSDPTTNVFQAYRSRDDIKKGKKIAKDAFPCILKGHKHAINECVEFFLHTPKERVEHRKEFQFKHCTLCLQSSGDCKYKKCVNTKDIPKILVCRDCKELSKTKHKACYSVFFCFNDAHKKPSNNDMIQALEQYIPNFKGSLLNSPINVACHFQVYSSSKQGSKPETLSRPRDPNQDAQHFNTSTGMEELPSEPDKVAEVHEDSIAVMQLLCLKGKPVLTLYDRGANQHLINGPLAEELQIKVNNPEANAIGVVSGGKIWTDYGTYQMYLGPTAEGKYYEIIAQGIKDVTGVIPRYSLEDINKEALRYSHLVPGTTMPPYVGGDKVRLLIGLKNSDLEPVCIMNLPSGIGLYKSVFKDIFGSMYCYGGPHRTFTSINKNFNGNVNHISVYFAEMINQYRYSPYPQLMSALEPDLTDTGHGIVHMKEVSLPYSYTSSSGNITYPTPLTSSDFKELGMDVTDECEDDSNDCPGPHCECPYMFSNQILKAKIPLSKQRTYIDEDDKDDTINFRCDKCSKCKCASSSISKMKSLAEAVEQEAIQKSVSLDLEAKKVYVDLPFTKPPEEFLAKRHGGDNNYDQALRVYKAQTKLSEDKKQGIRTVIDDLVEKQFMKKITDLPEEHQKLIENSKFKHYMPWRTVSKESASTPLRIVVDPSMSGLNLILAKGENKLKRINDILIRARTKRFIWSSDISKLYNRLHLKPSSYAYQLFLFKNSLSPDDPPDVFVMVVAWYGVSPSSNQALYALEMLATLKQDKYPLAFFILTVLTYVDDVLGGADSIEEREQQIAEVTEVLASGGFSLKYVLRSGDESEDSEHVKILGYRWNMKEDTISPGFTELNFNKKKRGLKSANPFPVTKPDDVSKLLETSDITRRIVVSKTAELWEPVGCWEPYKFQLKIAGQTLNGLDWDSPLTQESQEFWTERFKEFLDIPNLVLDRYIFPRDVQASEGIRLLCISDAAGTAGGAAIYAGIKLPSGKYSCKLLTSKSKLMSESVPRNELEGIRLAASLAYDVKAALGDSVSEVLFFTDSSIAMSWCHNDKKKLRMFVFNRVCEIRRLIKSVCQPGAELPLFHIDGKVNPADLLTKPNNLKPNDMTSSSIWISGYPWMELDLNDMPITTFSDLQLTSSQNQTLDQECFPEILFPSQANLVDNKNDTVSASRHCPGCNFVADGISQQICYGTTEHFCHCLNCTCTKASVLSLQAGKGSPALVSLLSKGYNKGINIMSNVLRYTWNSCHAVHLKKGLLVSPSCKKCTAMDNSNDIPTEYSKILRQEAVNYFLKLEAKQLSKSVTKEKLDKYIVKDGIYYMHGRLSAETKVCTEGLDYTVFFDNNEIKGLLPVISSDSDFFFALLMHIHHNVRAHAGTEATLRELMKTVFVIGNPRRVIQAVRKNCPRCRLLLRKTLELEMGNHPNSRMQISPPFYHCMIDICYGFKGKVHKYSRSKPLKSGQNPGLKIYALVIVCLLSGATNILALEGIECQDIVAAIERHAARYGIPSVMFVDQGTQLRALQNAEVIIRDANNNLRDSIGLEIVPSTAKSHCERGRVERKIKTLREMLLKTAVNTDVAMTALQWETVFSKMASQIDDLPMARVDKSTSSDPGWELLTPNRLKLGRSNNRSIEGTIKLDPSTGPVQLLKRIQDIQSYWYELLLDRLHHLIPRPSQWTKTDIINLNDIVVFRFIDNQSSKLETWKTGKVSAIMNNGRKITVSYPVTSPDGSRVSIRSVSRSPRDLCVISSASDLQLNSAEFFNKIKNISN